MQRVGVSGPDGRGAITAAGAVAALGLLPVQIGGAISIVGLVVLLVAFVLVRSSVQIVDAYEKRALTVLGEYRGLLEPGLRFVPPLVSETHAYDIRTQTVDVPKQEAITRDNSPVVANAVVYIRVMDAEKAFLEVEDYKRAVSNLAQTTLRSVLGDMELDDTLNKRQEINSKIRQDLSAPTDEWGVRVESVEVQEITPSRDVLDSMEQQTSAERRRRAMILEAQGERRAAIEKAEGDKRSDIIRAQGEKQAQILEAQGDAISTVLRARSADAMGEQAVIDKGLETFESIGKADSEMYVVPQELTSALGKYGKHMSGDGAEVDEEALQSANFDADDREMLGLDDIEEILGEIQEVQLSDDDDGASAEEIAEAAEEAAKDAVPDADEVEGDVQDAAHQARAEVEETTRQAREAQESPRQADDQEKSQWRGRSETAGDPDSTGSQGRRGSPEGDDGRADPGGDDEGVDWDSPEQKPTDADDGGDEDEPTLDNRWDEDEETERSG